MGWKQSVWMDCSSEKKEQSWNYTERSFACITQGKTKERLSKARCVFSPRKKKQAVRCKAAVSLCKRRAAGCWRVGCLERRAGCPWICKISGLGSGRTSVLLTPHPSYLNKHFPSSLIDGNAALASLCSEEKAAAVYPCRRSFYVKSKFAFWKGSVKKKSICIKMCVAEQIQEHGNTHPLKQTCLSLHGTSLHPLFLA